MTEHSETPGTLRQPPPELIETGGPEPGEQPLPTMTAPALGTRAARGALAVLVGQVTRIVIQIVSVSILARLLDPADYGLVAIVLAIVGVGEIFRDFGLSTAAVQAAVVTSDQRDKLFWVNTGIGAVLTLACIGAAPGVAVLFDHDALVPITQALAFTFLLNGMAAQHEADLNRNLRFSALVSVNVGSQAIGTVAAVVFAWADVGYWALVIQQLVAGVVTLAAFVALTRWIPRLPRRGVSIRSFVRFGVGMVGTQVIGYLNSNVDTVTIGLRFSATQLGYYNRGYQLLMRPLNQLRAPTTSVALPVLRMIREDVPRTDAFLIRGQRALGYSLVAAIAVVAGAAHPIVVIFLGERWSSVAPVFALLAVAGIFQTISYVANWVYLARGLTGKLVWYSMVSLAIKIVCVLVGSHWGIVGVAAGFAVAPALAWPISIWWLARLTPLPVRGLYVGAGRILGCAALSGAATYATVQALSSLGAGVQLAAGGCVGAAVYGLLAVVVPAIRADAVDVFAIARRAVSRRSR